MMRLNLADERDTREKYEETPQIHRYLSIVIRVKTRTDNSEDNMARKPEREHFQEEVHSRA